MGMGTCITYKGRAGISPTMSTFIAYDNVPDPQALPRQAPCYISRSLPSSLRVG